MEALPVKVIPSYVDVGKTQAVVVIFPCNIPQDQLVTLELCCSSQQQGTGKKSPSAWKSWVPGQPLGSNVLHSILPEIPYAGEVEVRVKVSRETFAACPSFKLRVMSPLETIFQAASTPQKSCSPNGSAPLACLAAYLLHTHEKDQNRLGHMDKVVSGLLQSQSSICSDWDLSSVVFGKYGSTETLLHLLVRCKLEGAVSVLLQQKTKGKEAALQQRDYKGRTPSEIARKKGSKKMAEMLVVAMDNSTEKGNQSLEKSFKFTKSKSLDHKLNLVGIMDQDTELTSSIKVNGEKTQKRRLKPQSNKKGTTLLKALSPPPPSDDWQTPEEGQGQSTPCSPTSLRYYRAIPIPADSVGPLCASGESLRQLVNMCLYSASVLTDHRWSDPPFGDKASLKKGDVFYVMKELGRGMCHGVCNGFYWTLPKSSLATNDVGDEDPYEQTEISDAESSDGYEEVLDPINLPFGPSELSPPPPLHIPSDQVVGRQFKLPQMREAIREHGSLMSPPRLHSDRSRSSSHDSGLDHMGLPRQLSPPVQEQSPPPSIIPHGNSRGVTKTKPLPVPPMKQRAPMPIPNEQQSGPTPPEIKRLPTPPQRRRGVTPPPQDTREPVPLPKQLVPTPPQKKKMVPPLPVKHQAPEPLSLDQRPRLPTPPEEKQPFPFGQTQREPTPPEPKPQTPPQTRKRLPFPPPLHHQQATATTPPEQSWQGTKPLETKKNLPALPHKEQTAAVVEPTPKPKKKVPPLPEKAPAISKSKAKAPVFPEPVQRAPEPPQSDEDEYDDATTLQRRPVAKPQRKEQPFRVAVCDQPQPTTTTATNASKPASYLIPEKQGDNGASPHLRPQHPASTEIDDYDEDDYVDASSHPQPSNQGQQQEQQLQGRWQHSAKDRPRKAPVKIPLVRSPSADNFSQQPSGPPSVKPRPSLPRQHNRPPHSQGSSHHVAKEPQSVSEDSVPSSFSELRRRLEKQLAS